MPQAILLEDVESLGEKGAVVDVSNGYLRNYLLPRKLAESATKGSIEAAAKRREAAERRRARLSTAHVRTPTAGQDGADDPAAGGR